MPFLMTLTGAELLTPGMPNRIRSYISGQYASESFADFAGVRRLFGMPLKYLMQKRILSLHYTVIFRRSWIERNSGRRRSTWMHFMLQLMILKNQKMK